MTATQHDIPANDTASGLYRDIVEGCADAIVIAGADQKITFLNPAAQALFGYAGTAAIGQPLAILIPRRVRRPHEALFDGFRDGSGRARYMETRDAVIHGLRADGTEFPVNISIVKSGTGPDTKLVAIVRDITKQQAVEAELTRLATTDPLTGIHNRRSLRARADQEYARAKRYGRPMSLAMIDIDNFKAINDTFGHDIGDLALCHVVDSIVERLRKPDVAGRWGGEEFALILPDTSEAAAVETCQRLRRAIAQSPFNTAPDADTSLTVSIGIAGFGPGDLTLDNLFAKADEALYLAKRTGRNKVCAISDLPSRRTATPPTPPDPAANAPPHAATV